MLVASIITKNEEKSISSVIKTLSFADKIILVDNSSTDRTLEIAKKFKKVSIHVVDINLPHSVAAQRNLALKYIPKEAWIYFSDADEIIPPKLREEILEIVRNPNIPYGAYQCPRTNVFLGKSLQHGGWYPDYQIRLIKRKHLDSWVNAPLNVPPILYRRRFSYLKKSLYGPHDKPLLKDETLVGRLKNPYLHFNHRSIEDMLRKTPRFLLSELSFQQEYETISEPSLFSLVFSPLKEFFIRYLLKRGFLDGKVGLIESLYMSFSSFLYEGFKWQYCNKPKIDKVYKKYFKG